MVIRLQSLSKEAKTFFDAILKSGFASLFIKNTKAFPIFILSLTRKTTLYKAYHVNDRNYVIPPSDILNPKITIPQY